MFSRLFLTICLLAAPAAADLRVVALGDMPYGAPERSYPAFQALIAEVNAVKPDLVIHVGDIRGGETTCADAVLDRQRVFMDRFQAPVLYTPGDNEWTDCHRKSLGAFKPTERLEHLRATFFDTPASTLGARPVARDHQGAAGFPENARIRKDGVLIFTVHVVGSNDGAARKGGVRKADEKARRRANLAWIEESFALAKDAGARAVVVALHADMFRGKGFRKKKQTWKDDSPYRQIGEALAAASRSFGKPVVLVYGDGHDHDVSTPLSKTVPNLTAVEVYGDEDMHAVELTLTDGSPAVLVTKIANPMPRN